MVACDIWQQGPPLSATHQAIEFEIACHGNENRPPHPEIGVVRHHSLRTIISKFKTENSSLLQN